MAEYNHGSYNGHSNQGDDGSDPAGYRRADFSVDFSVINDGQGVVQGDIVHIRQFPEGARIVDGSVHAVTACSGLTELDVGTKAGGYEDFVDGMDCTTAGTRIPDASTELEANSGDVRASTGIVVGSSNGEFGLELTALTGTLTEGKVRVSVVYMAQRD
jgi:hypothetical protein